MKYLFSNMMAALLCSLVLWQQSANAQIYWGASQGPSTPSSSNYDRGEALQEGAVLSGIVLAVRAATVEASTANKAVGTALGGALGAMAGNKLGHGDNGKRASALVMGVLGVIAGNKVATHVGGDNALELIVKVGERAIVVVQADDGTPFVLGQTVYIAKLSGNTRVLP